MSIKVTVPWQIRLPAVESESPRSRNWWNRQHFTGTTLPAPLRSITMQEDDLDHLGTKHQAVDGPGKTRRLFEKLFRNRS